MKNLKTTAPYNNPNSMQGGFLAKPKKFWRVASYNYDFLSSLAFNQNITITYRITNPENIDT